MRIHNLFHPKHAVATSLLLCLGLSSCILDPESPAETRTFIHSGRALQDSTGWHLDSSLYTDQTYGFRAEPGETDLFEYFHKAADNGRIADDEFSESLYFMVPAVAESLVIDSALFSTYRARYLYHCFCFLSYGVVDSGRIVIRKTGTQSYRVEADIGFAYRSEDIPDSTYMPTTRGRLKFTRTFTRE